MTFTRIKGLKSKTGGYYYYAYMVESKWIKEIKQPRQKIIKYLGAVVSLKPIKKETQYELFKTQPCCVTCQSTERLTIDHIIPLSRGGTNDTANIQVLCVHCNLKKGNHSGIEDISQTEFINAFT